MKFSVNKQTILIHSAQIGKKEKNWIPYNFNENQKEKRLSLI